VTILSKELVRASQRDIFSASTPAAGVAPGTVFSTTPPLTLWNPADSKVNLVLVAALAHYVSGTLGAGYLAYGSQVQATAPTGGTPLSEPANVVGQANAAIGQAFSGSTVAGTPVMIRPSSLQLLAASPFVNPKEMLEGEIVVLPGQALVLQGIAGAGTSPLVVLAFEWVEQRY
jgi:hypothetical protein